MHPGIFKSSWGQCNEMELNKDNEGVVPSRRRINWNIYWEADIVLKPTYLVQPAPLIIFFSEKIGKDTTYMLLHLSAGLKCKLQDEN